MNGVTLGGSNTATNALLIVGDTVTLDFLLVTSAGPTAVQFFLEFSEDNVNWFREVAEEDGGKGVVSMPKVLRTFADNNGTNLADGTHLVSCQFTRRAQLVRLQMSVGAGACVATVTAPFGTPAQ